MDAAEVEEDQFQGEQPAATKERRSKLDAADGDQPHLNGCFDCNICFDYAADPVVTLCGHLYCWPCIYKWLRLESSTAQQCPVCKAALSQTTLVPLYGRGFTSKASADDAPDVPSRPSVAMTASTAQHAQRQRRHRQHFLHRSQGGGGGGYMMSSSSRLVPHPTMLGGAAIAVLPWVLGEEEMGMYYSNMYPDFGGGESPRRRQQEMKARRSLHRISVFLLCCAVLCLLVL